MTSLLTAQRPDIWLRGILLASNLTGLAYVDKKPLADGTITACGGSYYNHEDYINGLRRKIKEYEDILKRSHIQWVKDALEKTKKEISDESNKALSIPVPNGAMEWLLHEVGHWVASTPEEQKLPNYGFGTVRVKGWGKQREWQAWAFEEIIMVPFGPSRAFAPITQRDGIAFDSCGPIPEQHMRYVARQIQLYGLDVEEWRMLYGEWVEWGRKRNVFALLD